MKMKVFEYDDDIRRTAHAPQEMLSYLYRFSVFVWTSENDWSTLRFQKISGYMWTGPQSCLISGKQYQMRRLEWPIVAFESLLAEQVFKGSFLSFVTFDITLGRHICLTRSCEFDIRKKFLKHHNDGIRERNWRPL